VVLPDQWTAGSVCIHTSGKLLSGDWLEISLVYLYYLRFTPPS
jgi:hypothetical protein